MLAIRMQRTGRKGHAMFRMVVQDSRLTPTSGKVVARLGSYDPHAKAIILDKDKATFYLTHGAQPSDRVARLLKAEGVELPSWVKLSANKERTIRNADKRRSTRPAEPVVAEEAPAAEPEVEATNKPAETPDTPTETDAPVTTEAADTEETPEPSQEETATPEESASDDVAKEAETPEEKPAEEAEPAADSVAGTKDK